MRKPHVVQRRIKHYGEFLEPGAFVDASSWPSLRGMLNNGTLKLREPKAAPSAKGSKSQKKKSKKNKKTEAPLLPADVGGRSEEELMKLLKADLVDLAIEHGRPHSGTKAGIVSRLV